MRPLDLVLLPGLLCDAELWRRQRQDLADIARTHVADFTAQDSIAAMASSALALVPGRFALAGLSMGGYVALEIMRLAPERVERLALLDTSARPDSAEQRRHRRGLIELARKGNFRGVTPRLLPLLIHPGRLEDAPLVEAVTRMAERVGRTAFVSQQTAIIGRPDSRPGLGEITCPALVLCGREDALTPLDRSEEIAAAVPGARLVVVEDCGHLSTMERPEAVSRALRQWLTDELPG